ASSAAVTEKTGISGARSVAALVGSVETGVWPWLAAVAGVLMIGYAIFLIVTGRRWPVSSSKYQAVRMTPANGGTGTVSDWDSLSTGGDPTEDPAEDPR